MLLVRAPGMTIKPELTVGVLCIGGDWACAHGDLEGLRDIAYSLAARAPEPLHCELMRLAEACLRDPDRATAGWVGIKKRVQESQLR